MNARSHLLAIPSGDAAALAWQASVVANGGTVSAGRLAIVDTFIVAEKAAGTWALTDDYWPLWGEDAIGGLTSLKQRRLATAVNVPTFTADRGYAGNGTTSYLSTGFIQSVHSVAMSGANLRLAVYQRDNLAVNTSAAGVNEAATRGLFLRTRGTTNFLGGQANCTSVNSTATVATSAGWSAVSRTSTPGNLLQFWKNGATITTPVPGTFTASSPTTTIFICAHNVAGTPTAPSTAQIAFGCIGASLSSAQEAAQYTNVQAWATAIGANV